jgi:hypothetical protein
LHAADFTGVSSNDRALEASQRVSLVGCAPDLSLALAIVQLFVVRPTRNVEPLLDSAAIQLKETTMNLIELGTVTTQTQGGPPNRYLDAGQGFKPVP